MHNIAPTARVAFQGEPAAFSQIAARKLLGDHVQTVACPTFESLFDSIAEGRADLILAPLENTLAGPVLRCYDLLYQSCAYHDRRGRPAHRPLRHRMPRLLARRRFAASSPIPSRWPSASASSPPIPSSARPSPKTPPAASARSWNCGDPSVAAIASEYAAREYGAQILVSAVEDDPNNFTRFALLQPSHSVTEAIPDADATTLVLTVTNQAGALFHALEPFALNSVDLMSLVSRPLVGTPWHYRFFFEVAAAASDPRMVKALAELQPCTVELRVLGSYHSGK